ncbi:MAG: tetratricopeptide repeat protein [Planctomycetota bacterium]|nr:tetratricopeptide repeat protein [Planctomycetota bacterium]
MKKLSSYADRSNASDISHCPRIVLSSVFLVFTLASAMFGCGGPTKTGLEARRVAADRFNRVGGAVASDQAKQALDAGQFKDALTHIDRVVVGFPTDPKARLLRGRIVLEMGRLELAMTEFKNAAELDPSCAECLYYQGVVSQRWGRDEDAMKQYSAALTIEPTSTHYLLAQAETLLVLGRIEDAKTLIEDMSCHFEFSSALAHLRSEISSAEDDHAQALRFMELAVTLASNPTIYQEDLAHIAFHAKEWDRCLIALSTLPKKTTEREDIMRMRARCLAMTGRALEARDLLVEFESSATGKQEGITLDHDLALGYIAWMVGDLERTDVCARRLMGRNPKVCDGYLLKGMVFERQGDFTNAVKFLTKAAELAPNRRLPQELLLRAEAAEIALGGVLVVGMHR